MKPNSHPVTPIFVGYKFFDFLKSPTKIGDMVVNNLMHVPIDQRSKTKIIGFPDLQLGVGELWVLNK